MRKKCKCARTYAGLKKCLIVMLRMRRRPLESVLPASPPEQQGGGGDIISGAEQTNKTPEAQFGRDANGHPFPSEQAAKDYDDLVKKGIRDPRETGAWPPGPQKEKGLFEEFSDWLNR